MQRGRPVRILAKWGGSFAVTPLLKCWQLVFLFAWIIWNKWFYFLSQSWPLCHFLHVTVVFSIRWGGPIQPNPIAWKHQSQIKHYSVHRSFKINSLCSKSSQSQVNGMYSGSQAEVQSKNRRAEEAPDGHNTFSTYCHVYWEEPTAVAVLDKWVAIFPFCTHRK